MKKFGFLLHCVSDYRKKCLCASSSKGFVLLFLLLQQVEALKTIAGGVKASGKAAMSANKLLIFFFFERQFCNNQHERSSLNVMNFDSFLKHRLCSSILF